MILEVSFYGQGRPISPRLHSLSSGRCMTSYVVIPGPVQSKDPSAKFKVIGEAPHQSPVAFSEFKVIGDLIL